MNRNHLIVTSLLLFLKTLDCRVRSEVKYECPLEDPHPCICREAPGKVFLQCSSLQNRQELHEAFNSMAGRGITELFIKDSNVSHIPRDLFKDSPVKRIKIKNCLMMYLFDREIEHSAKDLTEIVLDEVIFEGGLDWDVLDNLIALQMLSVTRSEIENIPYSMSELNLPIETLILQDNIIENIYDFAFQNLNSLKVLKLQGNFLKSFRRNLLPLPESGIQYLDLSSNRLVSLPDDIFNGLTELHSLLLAGNNLVTLPTMENILPTLFYLDLADNPLECSCEMTWLLTKPKPFHLFGQCFTQDIDKQTDLKDLTREDFMKCFA